MRIPQNQIDFEKKFQTEEQCLNYMKGIIFPKGYICRKCHHSESWINKRGIMEKGTGRIRMSILSDASKKSLSKFIVGNIETGSHLITDGWKGYGEISKKGYSHEINNETKIFENEEILPNVHSIASLLKRWLLGTHQNYRVEF